jgi:hypothetical protein
VIRRSLDPHVTSALNALRILVNLYEGLGRYRPGTLEPMRASPSPGQSPTMAALLPASAAPMVVADSYLMRID